MESRIGYSDDPRFGHSDTYKEGNMSRTGSHADMAEEEFKNNRNRMKKLSQHLSQQENLDHKDSRAAAYKHED